MEDQLRERRKTAGKMGTEPEVKHPMAEHPGGRIKHNGITQIIRLLLVAAYFVSCTCSIVATQFLGVPLYWLDRDLYYAYMALTKQSFGVFVTTLTQWWAPTVIRISGDASVAGQLRQTADGRVETLFPERLVMIANHQLYSDWLYLWWIAYANSPHIHGHIYIILKESLKHVPIIGWGMRFYGFIFMSRKMAVDQPRMAYRLGKLKKVHTRTLSGTTGLDPMWLILFPEGTNASDTGRAKSARWAKQIGVKDVEHCLLPRSTGSFFCLNELKGSVEYVYDCTLSYEGVQRGDFGQDSFTLRSMYLQGRPPPSVNMYWRRFRIADIPLHDSEKFDIWLRDRWYEKDALMEQYIATGRFPACQAATNGDAKKYPKEHDFIETEVKLGHWWEVGNIFMVMGITALISSILARGWTVGISTRKTE